MQAQLLTDFLLPMLEYVPEQRATAREMLEHPWLQISPRSRAAASSAGRSKEPVAAPEERSRRRPTQFDLQQQPDALGPAPKRSRYAARTLDIQ